LGDNHVSWTQFSVLPSSSSPLYPADDDVVTVDVTVHAVVEYMEATPAATTRR
jgi:hypothetical protein